MTEVDQGDGDPRQRRKVCPDCGGDGYILRPTLIHLQGKYGTVYSPRLCKTCLGEEWLPGIAPPV